jgi:hypothetical protein
LIIRLSKINEENSFIEERNEKRALALKALEIRMAEAKA